MGRGAQWRAATGIDPENPAPEMASQMITGYLSPEHLGDLDGQCPMIALPYDVARIKSRWFSPRFASEEWCWRGPFRIRRLRRTFGKLHRRRLSVSLEMLCSRRIPEWTILHSGVRDTAIPATESRLADGHYVVSCGRLRGATALEPILAASHSTRWRRLSDAGTRPP
jgi:hypothetical protein